MNFTREPIIETIITAREGCRLVIRSSRNESQEEYTVDAVEVVSFGHALFFRSLEKPRPFLVPVSDYEVVETKESRPVLKNAQFEKTIKIGGGREGSLRKEAPEELEEPGIPLALEEELSEESPPSSFDKKRGDRHRRRRRRGHEERDEAPRPPAERLPEKAPTAEEAPREPASFPHLIPPPTTLISRDSLQRYKEQQSTESTPEPKPPIEPESDSSPISRVAVEPQPFATHFSPLSDWTHIP